MRKVIRLYRACPVITILFFLLLWLPAESLNRLSRNSRERYLRASKVWHQQNIPQVQILTGPSGPVAALPDSEVECHYLEEHGEVVGATPKFKCQLQDSDQIVRIKFSRRETFAEVAGTRLLWALGFYSDKNYPVKLRCYGCPQFDPSKPSDSQKRMERVIPDAVMEQNFEGEEIAQFPDQGWRWEEIDRVDPASGGSTAAEVDALKLLAVFLQHSDSKPPQQRLGCFAKDLGWHESKRTCKRPVMMIQDLGATFGAGGTKIGAFSAMYYKGWERVQIWNIEKEDAYQRETGHRVCFGRLTSAFDNGLIDPQISEDGRKFLAGLLNQLSDDQIRDLFRAARADQTDETIVENERETRVTIEHWLEAFKRKRNQINDHFCGS